MKVLLLVLLLSACGPLSALSSLGGGPSATAIGTQLGKENTQQVVASQTKQEAGRDIVSKEIEAQKIDQVTVTNQNTSPWLIIALILGWILPSPNEISRWFISLFKRR